MSCETETSPTSASTSEASAPGRSRVTLAFRDAALEAEYRLDRARRSVRQLRVAIVILMLVSAFMMFAVIGLSRGGGYIDGLGQLPGSVPAAMLLTTGVFIAFWVTLGWRSVWPWLQPLTFGCAVVWFAVDVPTVASISLPYVSVMTLSSLIVTYGILRLRFAYAASLGWLIVIGHLAVAGFTHALDGPATNQFLMNLILAVTMNVILMVASYQLEAADRDAFWNHRLTLHRERALRSALVELTETESRLLDAEREAAQSRLVAGLLHEINNPAAVLRSGLQLWDRVQHKLRLAEARGDREEIQRLFERLRPVGQSVGASALRVTKALKGLETFVGLDAGQRVRVDIADGVREAARLVHAQRGADISVHVEPEDARIELTAHRYRINQVWLQLLDNAAKAVGAGGEVAARVRLDADGVHVEVEDEGPGMDAAALESVFQVGFTDRDGRVRFHLGLPLCRRVVQEHGGTLELRSAPGVGTRAQVWLPLVPPAQSEESLRPRKT